MRVTSKSEYAVRACLHLAGLEGGSATAEAIATAAQIPNKYLENILAELRTAGLVRSRRGSSGGYRLARPASDIRLADVLRSVEGPLATVRGQPAEELDYDPSIAALQQVWVALRAAIRSVLESVSIEDVATGALPSEVLALSADPASWQSTAERSARLLPEAPHPHGRPDGAPSGQEEASA
jgi:Rrf2 family protein